jgi:hypothetical protein
MRAAPYQSKTIGPNRLYAELNYSGLKLDQTITSKTDTPALKQ